MPALFGRRLALFGRLNDKSRKGGPFRLSHGWFVSDLRESEDVDRNAL
jgi:hypothetical protein